MNMLQVSVWRGGADGGYRIYEAPRRESQSVLDVVAYIQRNLDLSVSCRVGMCGVREPRRQMSAGGMRATMTLSTPARPTRTHAQ